MKTKLDEITERLRHVPRTIHAARDPDMVEVFEILKDLVEEVKRVDQKYKSKQDRLDELDEAITKQQNT